MKLKKTQDSFRTILQIVIGCVFAVALLAISYKAAVTSREDRSHAAEIQTIYKSWEFNGKTTEGWLSANITGVRVTGGLLVAKVTGRTANPVLLSNKSVSTILPQGNKYIKVRLAVQSLPVPSTTPVPKAPATTNSPVSTPSYTISITYYTNKGAIRSTPLIRGIADGKFYEYSVLMPEINTISVGAIQITLSSLKAGTPIQLDYVRLVGSPPPTPTPVSCSPNGSACSINICPTMSPCPSGAMCAQVMPVCTTQNGICTNGRCAPYPTPCPTICNSKGVCFSACPSTPTPNPPTPSPNCIQECDTKGVCKTICSQPVPPSPTSIPSPIIQAACNYGCLTNSGCQSGLICYTGVCRNPNCTEQKVCSCNITPTPTPSQ